jgi:hypothetical protein
MKIGDMVFAEHHEGVSYWVGVIMDINDEDPTFVQYEVLWNDGDVTWEDDTADCLLTKEEWEKADK